jgi:hypothetical protein
MDAQTVIVLLAVLAAALFMGNKWRRTLLAARVPKDVDGPGCGPSCGCGK